jgi:hypothetical protein
MILIIEDSYSFANHAAVLIERYKKENIRWTNSIRNAMSFITKDPGHEAFTAVILDLDMPDDGLPEEALEDAHNLFEGYAFYTHILHVSPRLQERTVFFTANGEELQKKLGNDKYSELTVINKDSTKAIDALMAFLDNPCE